METTQLQRAAVIRGTMSMEGEGENSVSKIGSLELLSTIGFEGKL